MKTNHELMQAWFEEVWNQGDETAIDRYFSKDGIAWGIGGEPLNHDQYKEHFHSFRKEMPNIKIEILDAVSEGEKIALRCKATIDKEESIPRTFEGMTFCIVRDGWLMEAWNVWDFQEMMKQIGKEPITTLEKGHIK